MSGKVNPIYKFIKIPIGDGKAQNWPKAEGTKPEVKGSRGLSIRLSYELTYGHGAEKNDDMSTYESATMLM